MNCIKCGKNISDGELFCIDCSLMPQLPVAQATASKSPRAKGTEEKSAKLQSRATKKTASHPPPAPKATESAQSRKRPVALVISLVLTLLVAMALSTFIFMNWGKLIEQRANLRVREADVTLRETDVTNLKSQLTETTNKLAAAQLQIIELNDQIGVLNDQLSGTQSTMSQTQYDMSSQQQQMQKLAEENTQLTTLVDQLEQATTQLDLQLQSATSSNQIFGAKATFLDKYVVFVNNDGSKLYHKYDCKDFTRQSFWAYSRKLAESNGYSVCSICG